MKEQLFTSAATSINSKKAPAVYGMKYAIEEMRNKRVIDIGGGRYDTAIYAAQAYGADVSIYDPYNRSADHNAAVMAGNYDVAVISNVLNVIDSATARKDLLTMAASKARLILVTVYEGNGSGIGRQTGADCWQENRKTADYCCEISRALPNYYVERFGKLIIAVQADVIKGS